MKRHCGSGGGAQAETRRRQTRGDFDIGVIILVGKGWESSAQSDDPCFEKPVVTPLAHCATLSGSLSRRDPVRACEAGRRRPDTDHIGHQNSRHASDWGEPPVYDENDLWHAVDALIVGNTHNFPQKRPDRSGRTLTTAMVS